MNPAKPFRPDFSAALLAFALAAFAVQAGAAAGRVEFAFGGANITGADGRTRSAVRGGELDTGDVVRTTDGRVQIRMSDGSYISLQPNTEFGIKNYRFEGKTDGSESAVYSLLKGAMRTVTGLVGRVNRSRYQVGTPTATVGIRGTGGLIQILPDGATLVQGTSGIWFLANAAGSIDIPAGVSGLAPADPNQSPRETDAAPTAGPMPPLNLPGYVQGEQRTSTGEPVITPPTGQAPPSGSGYGEVFAYGANFDGLIGTVDPGTGSAIFNAAGQLTEFTNANGTYRLDPAQGTHAEFGTDGIIAWGRWTGTVSSIPNLIGSESYNANQGLHYVVGVPTSSLPLSGQATYTLVGATSPTYVEGSTSPGTFSGTLAVNFSSTTTVDANFSVAMPDRTYGLTGRTTATSAFFSMNPTVTGCVSGCSANVGGVFIGPTAERAGVGYIIYASDPQGASRQVVGAAAFSR